MLFNKNKTPDDVTLPPHVVVRRSARARRLALRLDNKNRVVNLVVPTRQSLRNAYYFADDHRDWIAEQIATLPDQTPLTHSAIIPIMGRDITIDVQFDDTRKTTRITIEDDRLIVHTNQTDPSARIVRFLKKMAKDELSILSHEKATQINKIVQSVRVGDTKSRWGSCSHDGRLAFSWRLIFAPPESFDYVVAHEVAHLVHMDHSKRFWAQCEALSTEYEIGKQWMRNNGKSLMRFT